MPGRIEFDWDPVKAASNLAKHAVPFEEAMAVFLDPLALSRLDHRLSSREQRWITIGLGQKARLLVAVHTYVDIGPEQAYVRIISARTPTKRERRHYEQDASDD